MKRLSFLTILMILFVCGINAQVMQQATATFAWIQGPSGADPSLCVFGNTIEDVAFFDDFLNLKQEVKYLRQKVEGGTHEAYQQEMTRLNARFMSVHIVQRDLTTNGVVVYFLVYIYEREGDKYYLVATNTY